MAVISLASAVYSKNQQQHAMNDSAKLQEKQTNDAASAQTDDRMKAAREQRAAARAASAESGASGNSADAILNDLSMQAGRDVSRIEKNRENGLVETNQQAKAKQGEINGALVAGVASASEKGASAAYSGYTNYIPKIPDAGQYVNRLPKATMDRPKFTIGT